MVTNAFLLYETIFSSLPLFDYLPALLLSIGDEKVIVLTFDDAVKSHRTFVVPHLKELGFGATFL